MTMASSSSSYVLWCADCSEGLKSKEEWILHLILTRHHDLVVQESRTWTDDDMRSCVVVMTDGRSRTSPATILKHFSDLGEGLLATNLLWDQDRSNVLIVQFESSANVDKLFALLGASSEVVAGTQTIQLRRLMDYMSFERQLLFPTVGLQSQVIKTEPDSPTRPATPASLPGSPLLPLNLKVLLTSDFHEIRSEIDIPNGVFQNVLNLLQRLQKILTPHFAGCKLFLFRHWYLKMKTPGTNELLIFIQHDNQRKFPLRPEHLEKFLQPAGSFSLLRNLISLESVSAIMSGDAEPNGIAIKDCDSGIIFSLVQCANLFLEVQTCQLLKNLTSEYDNDFQIRGLMMVVFYWASKNNLGLQTAKVTNNRYPLATPVPSALEWLIMFFLSRKVPSLKQLLQPACFDKSVESRLSDPGFPMNPDFIDNPFLGEDLPVDDPGFVLSVLTLAEQFFSYFGNYVQGNLRCPCILNTRDGQVIRLKRYSDGKGRQAKWHFHGTAHKLDAYEKTAFKSIIFDASLTTAIEAQQARRTPTPVFILHPLSIDNEFVLDPENVRMTWGKMSETGRKLRQFLKSLKNGTCVDRSQVSLKKILSADIKVKVEEEGQGMKRKRSSSSSESE